MAPNPLVYPAVIVGVVVGLVLVLYAEAAGAGTAYLLGGGSLVLVAMGVLTVVLARMDEDGDAADHH